MIDITIPEYVNSYKLIMLRETICIKTFPLKHNFIPFWLYVHVSITFVRSFTQVNGQYSPNKTLPPEKTNGISN